MLRHSKRAKLLALIFLSLMPQICLADPTPIFALEIPDASIQRSSTYWHPLGSFFLPGLAQFSNGQTQAGLTYSLSGATGLIVGFRALLDMTDSDVHTNNDYSRLSDRAKIASWGLQFYQTAGSLSAYHAFRSVAKQRQAKGEFAFLKTDETPDKLLLAPFDLRFMLRPTVFLPLLLLGGIIHSENQQGRSVARRITASNAIFAGATSYNAGVGEEALFRGYMMMNFRESWQSDWWSNGGSAAIFAAAHLTPTNRQVWIQFLVGLYLGWLTQSNNWTLSESIFLHTWWDIVALSDIMAQDPTAIVLPVLSYTF